MGPGPPRHPDRGLAAETLRVEAAFAGDHHIGAGEPLVQPDEIEDDVDARSPLGPQHRQGGEADPTGRTGALGLDQARDVGTQGVGDQPGVVAQGLVEDRHVVGPGTLLWTEDGGGPGRLPAGDW